MKTIISFCVVIAVAVALPRDTYDVSYDNFDVKQLLENPRTLKNYGKCFLGQSTCTPEGLEFKRAIPEALKTVCGKCTPKQRELVRIVVHAFMTKQPEIWKELVQKLDPNGKYTESFKAFLSETH